MPNIINMVNEILCPAFFFGGSHQWRLVKAGILAQWYRCTQCPAEREEKLYETSSH